MLYTIEALYSNHYPTKTMCLDLILVTGDLYIYVNPDGGAWKCSKVKPESLLFALLAPDSQPVSHRKEFDVDWDCPWVYPGLGSSGNKMGLSMG